MQNIVLPFCSDLSENQLLCVIKLGSLSLPASPLIIASIEDSLEVAGITSAILEQQMLFFATCSISSSSQSFRTASSILEIVGRSLRFPG